MINEVFIRLQPQDQDTLLNEIVEEIQKDRVLRLQDLLKERDEMLNRAEKLNDDISKLKKHIEKLNTQRLEFDFEKCNAPEHKIGKWAIGKRVKIHSNIHGHRFKIGQVVEIVDCHEYKEDFCHGEEMLLCSDGTHRYWVGEDEATLI